jgi:prepilin peptidase CpaA
MLGGVCFVGLLLLASISDVRSRRITNRLVLVIATTGIVFSAIALPLPSALARACIASTLGFVLWISFYALGMLGAGDVKFFAAAGCWLAPQQVWTAFVLTALFGAVLALGGMARSYGVHMTVMRLLTSVWSPKSITRARLTAPGLNTLPYGVAMALGLAIVGWSSRLTWLSHW